MCHVHKVWAVFQVCGYPQSVQIPQGGYMPLSVYIVQKVCISPEVWHMHKVWNIFQNVYLTLQHVNIQHVCNPWCGINT